MRIYLLGLLLCCAGFTFSDNAFSNTTGADNTLTEEEVSQGWQLLFDGKTLDGWRNFKKDTASSKWQVVDGALVLTAKRGGDLITQAQFENFDLKIDWWISDTGNSGIFVLADEEGRRVYAHAPEVQILDNEKHPDNKLENHLAGSLYDMVAAPAASHKPAETWNTTQIKHNRGQLSIWHNGHLVTDIKIGSPQWQTLVAQSKFARWQGFAKNTAGYIGLQDHGDIVKFKNIKLRQLP